MSYEYIYVTVDEEALERASEAVRTLMENADPVSVPLVADVELGDSWSLVQPWPIPGDE